MTRTPWLAAGVLMGLAVTLAARSRLREMADSFARASMPGARSYDLMAGLFRPMYARMAAEAAARVPRGAAVLDIGCGPGQLTIELARRGLRVTGLDIDPAMLNRARRNARRALGSLPTHPAYDEGDVVALPYPDASFDAVVSSFSFHHWTDAAAGLREARRVLRPAGRLLVWDVAGPVRWLENRGPLPPTVAEEVGLAMTATGRWRLGPLLLAERYELSG